MTVKNVVTTSTRPFAPRLSAAERRTAQITTLATQQAELKHEAAQRRLARELRVDASPAPTPRKNPAPKHPHAR
jgi:hypothetical protein